MVKISVLRKQGTSKHAVLGLMRALEVNLAETSIRVNCVTPLWTNTGLVPGEKLESELKMVAQGPEVVARSVAWLMGDDSLRGQTIYSRRGKYKNMEPLLLGTTVAAMDVEQGDMHDPSQQGELYELLKHRG